MRKAWFLALAGVAVALAVLLFFRVEPPPLPPEASRAAPTAAAVKAERARERAVSAPVPPPSPQVLNALPKPPAPSADHPLPAVPREPPAGRHGPTDKRGGTNPNAARELEILEYAFETLDDDVEACLQEWRKTEPTAPAEVMVGFDLDANGLQRAWIERDADVPLGVKSCFANAVYGLDWSHVVTAPAMITKNFDLSGPEDAGPRAR